MKKKEVIMFDGFESRKDINDTLEKPYGTQKNLEARVEELELKVKNLTEAVTALIDSMIGEE